MIQLRRLKMRHQLMEHEGDYKRMSPKSVNVLVTTTSQPTSLKRMDMVMTMEVSAPTGMQTNHGAQMLKESLMNGVNLSMNGAMLNLLAKSHKKLFIWWELNMKASSTGEHA
jgi:hypothetical protein